MFRKIDGYKIALWLVMGFFAFIALGIALLVYEYNQLGPASDEILIQSVPEKIEVVEVLDKDSDKWDASCLAFVMKISDKTAFEIQKQGLTFFDETTLTPRNAEYHPIGTQSWKKVPIVEMELNRPLSEIFEDAVSCSHIDENLKNKAYVAVSDKGNYYTYHERFRRVYVLSPREKLLFIAHLD